MNVDNFIIEWNRRHPIDFLWRKKYKVSFGSPEHRQMTHLDMYIEFREIKMIELSRKEAERKKDEEDMRLLGVKSDPRKAVKKMTKKELDEEYDNLDINQFDAPKEGGSLI